MHKSFPTLLEPALLPSSSWNFIQKNKVGKCSIGWSTNMCAPPPKPSHALAEKFDLAWSRSIKKVAPLLFQSSRSAAPAIRRSKRMKKRRERRGGERRSMKMAASCCVICGERWLGRGRESGIQWECDNILPSMAAIFETAANRG